MFVARGVLAGLRHAHDRGVVHRDIKPDNIFLAKKDGELIIKILDFGIAKLYAGNADDPATTRAGLTVGTPAYLSPEQAVGGAITPASDLYSTSVVLYEMLVGRVPFIEDDPLAMLTAHVGREPPFFRELAPDVDVPASLEAIVRRGLAKVAAERICSAQEYMQLLEPFAASTPGAARSQASSLMIPVGPHAQPLAVATPTPFTHATPLPFVHTPVPGSSASAASLGSAPTAILPTSNASRPSAVSVAEHGAPIPKKWLLTAAVCAALAVVLAIILFATKHGHEPAAIQPVVPVPAPAPPPVDRDIRLKAALHDLEDGKTCTDRKAAIATIVELGDPKAIPDLKRARYRGAGGVLGVGETNVNGCLTKDADAAIKELSSK
jgi:serine/threonine-protein kinase